MRFTSVLPGLILIATLNGCSSDEGKPPTTSGTNACEATGGYCAGNIPFRCAPGDETVTDGDRKNACGKSLGDNPVDVPCCIRAQPTDSGPQDTGATDGATDATTDAVTDGMTDSATDGATDGATDATSDVPADTSGATDARDGG